MSLWLPMLPIERLKRDDRRSARPPDPRAVLLWTRTGQRETVAARCPRAIKAGVRRNMPLSEARAILPPGQARIEPHDALRDSAALRAIAHWAHRFAPVVALDEPDGLLLDVTACARVFKGEVNLLRAAESELRARGYTARASIAPSFACAWAVARFAPRTSAIVAHDRAAEALAPLSVRALRLEADAIASLAEVGVDRIGHLFGLPRESLPSRFGPELTHRLDQALARALEPIEPLRAQPPITVDWPLAGPTTQQEAIETVTRTLLDRLAELLRAHERAVRRLDTDLTRSDLPPVRLTLSLSRPSRDPAHLWSLLRPRLEKAHLGFGVERIALTASRTARTRHEQINPWQSERTPDDATASRAAAELTDTLANHLGPDRITVFEPVESHDPHRAFRARPAITILRLCSPETRTPKPDTRSPPPADRPTLLFENPVPVRILSVTPDGPIVSIRWGADDRRILTSIGPERIAPEWWRDQTITRDFFKAQDETGRWLWLVRDPDTTRWSVAGVWS